MCRINQGRRLLLTALLLGLFGLLLQSCTIKNPVKGADLESSIIDKSMYLDTSALEKTDEDNLGYQTVTVEKGSFYNEFSSKAELFFPNSKLIIAESEYGDVVFEEYTIEEGAYVQKGEAIAKVHIESDSVDVTEKQLELQRLQESLVTKEADWVTWDKETQDDIKEMTDHYEYEIALLNYHATVTLHEQEREAILDGIADLEEVIADLQSAAQVSEIVAPISGYVWELEDIVGGDVLKQDTSLGKIIMLDCIYLKVKEASDMLSYGKQVDIIVKTGGKIQTFTGEVISLSDMNLLKSMQTEAAYIKVNVDPASILGVGMINLINVTTKTRTMNDVLLVEKDAVTVDNDITYVTALLPDGSLVKKGFISGGNNNTYYWVLSGLEEGTKIVMP